MKRLTSKEYYELQLGEDVITQASYMIFTYGISKILYQQKKYKDIRNLISKQRYQ